MYVVMQLYHYYISSESCDRFPAPDVSPYKCNLKSFLLYYDKVNT